MPSTRSSTSKAASFADASTSFDLSDDSSVTSPQIDTYDLKTLMLSIQANQKTIEANQKTIETITSRLTEHSISLESTSKTLSDLDLSVQTVSSTVAELPKIFEVKLENVQQDLCSDFSNVMNSFGTKFYQDLSSHHIDTIETFKNDATTMATISADVVNLNKNLNSLQEITLSKLDVEHIAFQKWQDELDPHIQSHYNFKKETTAKLENLDQTLQNIDNHLKDHPCYSSLPPLRVLHLVPFVPLDFINRLLRISLFSSYRKN
jgi:DNA repair exonuclease SbcCD ATPase subunit